MHHIKLNYSNFKGRVRKYVSDNGSVAKVVLPTNNRRGKNNFALLRLTVATCDQVIFEIPTHRKKSFFSVLRDENSKLENELSSEPDPNEWGIFEEPLLPMGDYNPIIRKANKNKNYANVVVKKDSVTPTKNQVIASASSEINCLKSEDQLLDHSSENKQKTCQNSMRGQGGLVGFMSRIFKS